MVFRKAAPPSVPRNRPHRATNQPPKVTPTKRVKTEETDNTYIRPPVASADPPLGLCAWARSRGCGRGGRFGLARTCGSVGGGGANVSRETMRTIPNSGDGFPTYWRGLVALPTC